MSDCFVLYLLLTCMKKKTSGADKFTNNNIINFCSVKKRTDMNVQSRDYKKRQQNKRHMRINMQNVTGRLRNLKQRFCR